MNEVKGNKNTFSSELELNKKLDEIRAGKKPQLSIVGELCVAKEFFKAFGKEIDQIKWSHRVGIDLEVKFTHSSESLKVEVKSSNFKMDFFQDLYLYGVPVKSKDFRNEFDLLAMVNFLPIFPEEKKSNIKPDLEKYFILCFPYNVFEKTKPNPYIFLPTTTLNNLKRKYEYRKSKNSERKGYIGRIKQFWNNYYKSIILEGNIINKVNPNGNYEIDGEKLTFSYWFGQDEECPYIREYHDSLKKFYYEEVINKWEIRINLSKAVQIALNQQKNRFEETFIKIKDGKPLDGYFSTNFCINCSEKCQYYPIIR